MQHSHSMLFHNQKHLSRKKINMRIIIIPYQSFLIEEGVHVWDVDGKSIMIFIGLFGCKSRSLSPKDCWRNDETSANVDVDIKSIS
jgi:hypothetical protein